MTLGEYASLPTAILLYLNEPVVHNIRSHLSLIKKMEINQVELH